jgi:nucleoside-diphosphate-sugar epimerase
VLENNIEGIANVLEAARIARIEPVVFLSSNHVVGMYELDNAPAIYELNHRIVVDRRAAVRPDSYYGISKAMGEDLGRVHAESGGPRFYAIRIGSVRRAHEDHPFAYAEHGVRDGKWDRGSPEYAIQEKRLKALWLSRRDFVQLVDKCLQYDGPPFDVFYGVSDNPRRWLDIGHARRALGYEPQDNAELWIGPPEALTESGQPGAARQTPAGVCA